MADLTRDEFLTHIGYVRADLEDVKQHLGRLNARTGQVEQDVAVLHERTGEARKNGLVIGGIVGGVAALAEVLHRYLGK